MTFDTLHKRYVGRGGLKLEFALRRFGVPVRGVVAADLGCAVGGFVDCLLQHGSRRVYAVDTGYGQLAWKLRCEDRVVVTERTNALHVELPEAVDLVTVDVAWTRQRLILPKAVSLGKAGAVVLSLLKPQYEAAPDERVRGVVKEEAVERIVRGVVDELAARGVAVARCERSPIRGAGGNPEFFLRVEVA